MSDKILLLVGKSGTGKTTIANRLVKKYGFKQVLSYTTRPPRYRQETGHLFVNDENFKKLDLVAYTLFNGYHYGATQQQVEDCDVYVIDRDGVIEFHNKYTGDKKVMSVLITADDDVLMNRMRKRGDEEHEIEKRMANDYDMFNGVENYVDHIIESTTIEETTERVWELFNEF